MTLVPIQVAFHGLEHSDALEADIREQVARLEEVFAGIMRCDVTVELPHRHRHEGRLFHVRITLTVPGAEPIVVSHDASQHGSLKDVEEETHRKSADRESVHRYATVAVHEAFRTARRRLREVVDELRGDVKTHNRPSA
jgi:ribosome-associated translation inhibitor RaiA